MNHFALLLVLLVSAAAQVSTNSTDVVDTAATSKLTSAYVAFAGLQTPRDVHIEGIVIEHAGMQDYNGTFVYESTSDGRTKLQLNLGDRSRTLSASGYSDPTACSRLTNDLKTQKVPLHNCLTPSFWLLPTLALNPGQIRIAARSATLDNSISIIRKHTSDSKDMNSRLEALSSVNLTLDPVSFLPTKLRFNTHPDKTSTKDIPVEVSYSDYRDVQGIKVPFAVRRDLGGYGSLDFSLSSVAFNTGTEAR